MIGPKTYQTVEFLKEKNGAAVTAPLILGAVWVLSCAINVCLVCIGTGMAVDCGFTK